MPKIDWEAVSDFERHPKLEMAVGDEKKVRFEDEGTFVTKQQLADAGAKFPRDCYVFTLSVDNEKHEWWVGAQAYSVVRQIKRLREQNGALKGVRALLKRVSDKTTETNYEIVAD
jgi:hypothetical protein